MILNYTLQGLHNITTVFADVAEIYCSLVLDQMNTLFVTPSLQIIVTVTTLRINNWPALTHPNQPAVGV